MKRSGTYEKSKPKILKIPKICYQKVQTIWPEMGPCGSVGAYIKTGRSYMAQDHFETPPDPKQIHERSTNDLKPV